MTARLLLLGRPGCGLCEEMTAELYSRFGPSAFALEQADVDSRPDWHQRYGLKIPVLMAADGAILCAVHLDVEAVEQFLGAAGETLAIR